MRYLFYCLLLFSISAQAQSVVRGRVADAKDQAPLIGANVLLIRLPDSVKTGTAVDVEGQFQFDNVQAGSYLLTVSFVGYQARQQPLSVPAGGAPVALGSIALQAGGVQLKGVVVTGQAAAATQRGDTTAYNARAFKTNPDANAQDLLTKMPGVTTGTDGRVQAQGETVQQVLVDGKPFFGNDPDAVLRNLPADAIDRVEVFDQQSEQSRFSGFNDGNTTKTLNLVIKQQYRNGRFGRAVVGGGTERYRASGNLNDFKGARKVSVLAQSNNVNEQNFGTEDLLGVVGNSQQGGRGGGGRGGQGGGGGNAGDFLVNQSGGISTTNAAGLNYANVFDKNTEVTGSYFFNRANNGLSSNTFRQFVLPEATGTTYAETAISRSTNMNNRANFRIDHKIDSVTSVLFRPRFSWQENNSTRALDGETARNGETQSDVNTDYQAQNRALNPGGDLLLRRRLRGRPGRTISLNLNGNYNQREATNFLLSTNSARPADNLNQRSTLDQTSWNAGGNLNYTEPLSKQDQLQANYSLSYAPNKSTKYTNDYSVSDGEYSQLNPALSNVFDNYYLNQNLGLNLRHATRTLQASAGAALQSAQLRGNQTYPVAGPVRNSFVNVLPQASLMWRVAPTKNLRVFYRTNTNAPSIGQLQAVVNNSNPLQLTIGNPALRQEYQHNAVLRYSVADPGKSSNFFALLSGAYTQNPIANRTFLAGAQGTEVTPEGLNQPVRLPAGGQLTQSTNLQQQYNLRSNLNYGRPLKALKSNLNLSLGASFNQSPGLVNDRLNYARTPALNAGVVLSSNISDKLDFTVSTTAAPSFVRNTLSRQLNSNYYTQSSRLRLNYIFGPGINFQTDLTNQYFAGLARGFNQAYTLWNASLGKKLGERQQAEIRLYAFDLLGQNRSIQRNVTEAYYEDVRTTVLQRYLMLMFTYNIRSGNLVIPSGDAEGPGRERGGRERGGQGAPPPGGGGFGRPPGGQ
ncbi:outer membrane beta-barrel protein [uncultured Hymenobacter sp.]|uniref:outer membrane beta-barrel protein n=1 Tax=uncultured Hymenobacter sp. TaxID=170016 RepID=UPI0035CACD09